MPAATAPCVYCITPAATLAALGLARISMVATAASAPDPIPFYGETRTHSVSHKPVVDPVYRLVLNGAVVHGADGVITVGRHVLEESLVRTAPETMAAWRDAAHWITLHHQVSSRLDAAEHLLCGSPGNYYHWLLDGVARSVFVAPGDTPLLTPDLDQPFHRDTGSVLPAGFGAAVALGAEDSVFVDHLGWTSSPTNMGAAFHPALRRYGAAAAPAVGTPRDIYLTRRDTVRRVLVNEAAVEQLCVARGAVGLPACFLRGAGASRRGHRAGRARRAARA